MSNYSVFVVAMLLLLIVTGFLPMMVDSMRDFHYNNTCVEMAKNIDCSFFDEHYDKIIETFPTDQVCKDYLIHNKTVVCSIENGREYNGSES